MKQGVHSITDVRLVLVHYTDGYGKTTQELFALREDQPAMAFRIPGEMTALQVIPVSKWLNQAIEEYEKDNE